MNTPLSLYATLAVTILAVVAALVLYILVRVIIAKLSGSRERGGRRVLISRLALPVVFTGAFFTVKAAFALPSAFRPYLDAGLIFFAFFFLIRLFDAAVLAWYVRAKRPFPLPDVLRSLALGVMEIIVLFAVLKGVLNINLTAALATSAVLTMVLGLALQGVLGNILSGISLHFSRSIHRGDWVSIGSQEGVVVDTNWRETRILDRSSNIIILPNNIVASEKITNFAQPDNRSALFLPFKISAAAPAQRVLDALAEAARDCPQVAADPAPVTYIKSFDDFGVSYLLKFWITEYARKDIIITDVGRLAWYKLKRRGIEISAPLGDKLAPIAAGMSAAVAAAGREAGSGKIIALPEPGGAVEREVSDLRDENLSLLLQSAFLRYQQGEKAGQLMVPEDDVMDLAAVVQRAVYAKGEVLCRQGDKGRSAYIVARGRIRGEIIAEEYDKKFSTTFDVGPGEIFGEMSLFTGMPRTASGTITEEADLLKIKAEDFAVVLAKNPDLAEVMAELIAARNEQNKAFLVKIKELSAKDIEAGTNKKSILDYLRRFVGLKK